MRVPHLKMAGFTLLPVVLAMSLIAAIAFLINRDNGINVDMVSSQMDTDRARYAAEAGLQAVNANIQSKNCGGGFPVIGTPVANNSFGDASYSAYATSSGGNTTSLVSTGAYNGTSVTLTRSNIYVYQAASKTYTLQPDDIAGIDTYIDSTTEKNFGVDDKLRLKNNQQNLLFKFDLSAFPAGSRPISSTFSIYATSDIGLSGVEYYRMTSNWVEGTSANAPLDGTTWNTSNGSTAWTPGGSYYPVKLNTSNVTASPNAWSNFDATDLTAAWLSGQYPNFGVSVKSNGDLGTIKFLSSDNSDAIHRPKITFNYLVPCGATGPVDPTSGVTLNPTADSFNDSSAVLANNGAATTIKVYYTPTRENRILIQFDTSSVPTGSTVQSAILRLYVSGVASATTNTKSIWANAINETWAEGAGNNTNKACPAATAGTSWNYRTNCTSWSYIHPPNTAQAWTAMASMPTARTGHVMATVNGKIYAIGGSSNITTQLDLVEEYDPATNIWTTKKPIPTPRWWASAAVVNGKIYVIGGEKSSVSQSANEVYDPATDTWAAKAPMPTAKNGQAVAVVNNKIYLFGGGTTTAATKTNDEYDPATNGWTSKTAMPTARYGASAGAVNGKIYVFGGSGATGYQTANEMFDPASNSWSPKMAMPVGTDAMAAEVLGNKIYLITGRRAGNVTTNSVQRYDVLNDSYATMTDYPISIGNADAAAVNGKIYVMGGYNGLSAIANHYQYDPGIPVPVATASDESSGTSPLAVNFNKGWINFDLKPLVQEWVDGVRPNNGVVLYTEVADQFSINSRENSSKNPQLIVTY